MKSLIILNSDGANLLSHLKQFNKCLYITATNSLRQHRLADKELAAFLRGRDNNILSFQKYRIGIMTEVSKAGGYISTGDQLYILCKVIETHFADPDKRRSFYNSRHSLFKLYSSLLYRDKRLSDEQLKLIKDDFTPGVYEIYNLYNVFYDRIKSVREADDELFSFDNQEGAFATQFEVYNYKQKCELTRFGTIVLDGFLFLNDFQKQLLFDAAAAGKQIVFITNSIDYLKDNFFNILAQELNLLLQYLDIKTSDDKPLTDIQKVRDNIFSGNKQDTLNGFRFIKPFANRDDELRYIIREISRKIKIKCGDDIETVFTALNDIAIVLQISPEKNEHFLNEILKEEGVFILKASYCKEANFTAPKIVYSKQEFLDSEVKEGGRCLDVEDKLRNFHRFYEGLKVHTRRRPFINYPVGQFITEIYLIIENKGLDAESFKKLLYSNWRYILKNSNQRHDELIRDFSTIEVFVSNAFALSDWLKTIEGLKLSRDRIVNDYAYKSHPLMAVSPESMDALHSYIQFVNALVEKLGSIRGKLSDHLEGLKSIFDFNDNIVDENDDERVVVEELMSAVNDIKASSMLDIDAEFFAANIKSMILDYEQEFTEDTDYDLILKTVTLENMAPYKTVYFPMFEAKKYPKQFDDEFPFSTDARKILNSGKYGIGYGLSKYVDRDYYLEIEKYFIKNGLNFAQEEIIFTQSEHDNGLPLSPSIYIRDIFALITSDIKYAAVTEPALENTKPRFQRLLPPKELPGDFYLSELLMFYLCPKYFYEASASKPVFKDAFQLKFYAMGVVYYKFFINMVKAYPDKVFAHDGALNQIVKDVLKSTIEKETAYFPFFTRLEKNDIYFSTLNSITTFFKKRLKDGQFSAKTFKLNITEPIVVGIDKTRIHIPSRILITNTKTGRKTEFDISPKPEFLKFSNSDTKDDDQYGNQEKENRHFHELISQLQSYTPDDDRIALVNYAYFKIVTQLSHRRFDGTDWVIYEQFYKDGVERLGTVLKEIKASNSAIFSVPSKYCSYCKIKNTCRDYLLGEDDFELYN